jgi:hypothetical protein
MDINAPIDLRDLRGTAFLIDLLIRIGKLRIRIDGVIEVQPTYPDDADG